MFKPGDIVYSVDTSERSRVSAHYFFIGMVIQQNETSNADIEMITLYSTVVKEEVISTLGAAPTIQRFIKTKNPVDGYSILRDFGYVNGAAYTVPSALASDFRRVSSFQKAFEHMSELSKQPIPLTTRLFYEVSLLNSPIAPKSSL